MAERSPDTVGRGQIMIINKHWLLTGVERIAGRGAFLLKAELAKGEAEHGH